MAWIYDKNGQQKCEIKRLSYTGTFMEVSRIMVTVESPEPIDFAIGDYIDWAYDGLRYKLDTAAGVEKQARKNSIGNAFIYENLVFLSPLNEANHVDFFDVVLGNTIEFLTNTAFSFYGTAWDYAKRLEANLGRITNDNWKIRIWTNGVCYDDSPATGIDTGAWESKLVDVSGIKCLEGFQQIYNLWGCAYVFSVVSGVNYVDFYDDFEQYAKTWQVGGVDKIFAYGKGNGLYKIRHTPDADHVLVTRLRAYGSSENLPANYYFNSPDYHVSGNESSELAISHLMLPASQWEKMGDKSPANAYLDSNVGLYGVREGVVLWDGSDSELGEIKPTIYGLTIQDLLNLMSSGDTYRPVEAKWPDTTQRIDKIVIGAAPTDNGAVAEAGYDYTETESIGSLSSHSFGATQVNRDIQFDDLVMGTTPSVSHLADFRIVPTSENKVAVSFDIPDTIASLIDNVTAYLIPYVDGVKVEDATFPCSVSEESIYITSGGVSYTKRYKVSLLDSTGNPIVFSTMLTGAVAFHIVGHINFRAGMEPDNSFPVVRNEYSVNFSLLRGNKAINKFFSVTVPQIGFDLAAAVSGSSKLCMRSGANQPREFVIVPSSVRYNESTDTWYIKCKRSVDQSTKTYFPNSDAVIASGDEYYLSGIAMPSLYVEIAAQKLLEAATAWLQYHSNPRMLSSVEVDNKIMAEEGIVLKEGMALPITDADLGITTVNQESRVIDTIRIEEGTDSIRTFSITLRDKKEKSSLDAAIRGATSDFATNSSVSEAVNAAVNTGHGSLTGRDLPNQHPISSISGLEEKLSSLSFFEQYVLPGNAGVAIKLRDEYVGLFSNGWVSSGGISESGGGGGGTVNALRNWANYRPEDTTQVLGSNLGKGLKDDIETLQSYFTNGVANSAAEANTLDGHSSTYFAHQVKLGDVAYNAANGIVSLPAYPTTLPASDVYAWAKKAALDVNDIPSITTGKISDLETWIANKGFVTKAVNDLTNYYLKSETYTQAEVNALIAAINQFHYEIYASLSDITTPATNVLYLIGPTGSGSDRYEEYVYSNSTFVKIGDTSIDLSGYVNAITRSYESDVYECPDCDYVYNPAIGDPSSGIAPGTSYEDLPEDWVCPVCGASKEDFSEGRQFVYSVNKSGSTIAFTHGRILLKNIDGVDDLKAIEALTGTSGLLRKTALNTWTLDTSSYLTGITSAMVVAALGYTPYNAANFTQANIKSTLGISDWALASTKPSYTFTEIGSKPTTLAGYGISDAYINNGTIVLGANSITPLTQHQSLTGYVNAIAEAGQTDMYTCPVCGYRYDPSVGDPDAGIAPGTPFADLPSDWECPICQTGKDEFELGGTQYVKAVSKPASSSMITFTEGRVSLADIDGANSLKGIAYLSGTSGVLKKTGPTTWELDPNAFPTSARELTDADDLCYVDPDEGVSVTIDDPGVTGTVLWGAESANQVALSVNGVSKLLLKSAAIAGLESSISTLSGYFINGSARNALSLGGHNAEYFATASGLSALQSAVAGKQDTIVDLAAIRSGANHGETAYGWGNHASAGYATQNWVNGQLALYPYQIVVNGDAFGSVNGTIELPDYPTTLPASDVYAWAKASVKPSYNFSEIGSKPTTLGGYGITDAYISNGTIVLGSNSITPLTSHQSLSGYAHQVVVNGDAFEAINSVIELPDYPTTLPASDVYAWAKAATKPTYTATEVGLGNVTNDAQVKRTEMGAASGVATLGTDGKIPASQLPSYVDDVLEYASLSAFPATGESGKIYVALDTNKTYRWSGTTYTEISPSIVIGTTTGTAFDGGSGYAHVTDGDIHVTAALKTAWSAKYDLPSGGIPSTDLASAIQTSLGHGDTAYGWGDHALAGYFPATSFTKANIKTVLEISDWALAANKPSYNFSEIGSTPTTLGGYGITDAKIENGVITLGSNTITPLTQHQSLAGYVNAISPSAETDVHLCPDCDYFYDPAIGDPIGGIAVGTAFADLPSDWVCPICGASKADFTAGGRQFVSGVSKSSGSSTISFTLNRLALRDLSGANNLKAIEYASGSGLLKKNADGTWGFDANSYLTGITSSMVTTALGYTPFNSANFTQANIQSTLGISNWALAASKPSYAFSELSSHPTTLSGYGITDAAAASDLLSYLPLAGGTMTGQLVVPLLKINGPTTDYVELASLAGELYVGSGALSRLVFDTGNYTSYVYTKAQINEKDGILASGISSNSARLDSIEDWILGVNADTVGLGLVENIALSTWPGSTNITTLGTITTGVWNGTNIAANKLAIDFNWVLVGNAATYDTDDHVVVN